MIITHSTDMIITHGHTFLHKSSPCTTINLLNPIKGDVSDSELSVGGGQFDTTSEMNEGVSKSYFEIYKSYDLKNSL